MHFWGLTMNVLTCMTLVISVGLCVDFSAHIVHFFLAAQGTRDQRVLETMTRSIYLVLFLILDHL